MIPDDLLDQLNKLKYLEKTTKQMKEFNEQVIMLCIYSLLL